MLCRILLADDHALFREGLKHLLEARGFTVVGEAADGHAAVRAARSLAPDIVVMDVGMPGLNGIDAARELRRDAPTLPIILLTMHDEPAYVAEALGAGARGFVLKTEATADLLRAVEEVMRGGLYVSPRLSSAVQDTIRTGSATPVDPLSPREREVLQLVAEGHTNKGIAGTLVISVKTVESHRASIMRKLDVHDTAALVRYAIRHRLIDA
jgi:DNA-binding NarL/FixJ family response regulator